MTAKQKAVSQASATELLKATGVASVEELHRLLEKGRQVETVEAAKETKANIGVEDVSLTDREDGLTEMTVTIAIGSEPIGFKGDKAKANKGQPKYGDGNFYLMHDGKPCVFYFSIGGTTNADGIKEAQAWLSTQS